MLWNKCLSVKDFKMDTVIKFLKRFLYYLECPAPIVRHKILDVFQIESLGTMSAYYVSDIKEQSPLSLIFESCFTAQAVFL